MEKTKRPVLAQAAILKTEQLKSAQGGLGEPVPPRKPGSGGGTGGGGGGGW
jgi:hypothetical protein